MTTKAERINEELQNAIQMIFELQSVIPDGKYVDICNALQRISGINNEEHNAAEAIAADAAVARSMADDEEDEDDEDYNPEDDDMAGLRFHLALHGAAVRASAPSRSAERVIVDMTDSSGIPVVSRVSRRVPAPQPSAAEIFREAFNC